jgi:hypothetical protein
MFSSIQGFTSISDLNQQFVNLTNALTNLDTLQPDGESNNTNNSDNSSSSTSSTSYSSSFQDSNNINSNSNNNHDEKSENNNEINNSNVIVVHNADVNADHNIIMKSTSNNNCNSNDKRNIRSDNGINKIESESKQKEINVILDDFTLTMKQLKDEQLKNSTLEQRLILLEHDHNELNNKHHDYKILSETQILELKKINDDKTTMMEILQHKHDLLLSSSSSSPSSSSSSSSDASDALSSLHIVQLEQLTNDKNKFKHLYDESYSRSTALQLKVDQSIAMIQKLEHEAIERSKQYNSQLENERSQSLLSIQEIIENHKNDINKYEIKYKEYEDKLLIANNEISSLKMVGNQQVVSSKIIHDQIINELNSQLIHVKKEVLMLTNNNQQLNNDYQQIIMKCSDYTKQISNYEDIISNNQNSIQQSSSNYNELNSKYHEKEKYSLELEQKISNLTDKLKEVMQKYADFQSKSRNQAQNLEGRVSELTKLCQAKVKYMMNNSG